MHAPSPVQFPHAESGPSVAQLAARGQPDRLMENVGRVALVLQKAVDQGDHARVRGELLQLGTLAWPVVVDLCERLKPEARRELLAQLVDAMRTATPPSRRAMSAFNGLVTMFGGLKARREI